MSLIIWFDSYKFATTTITMFSRIIDSGGSDIGYGVTCDSSGNVYVAGVYNGTPSIINQYGNFINVLPTSTNNAGFVCKFDKNGVYQYSRTIDSTGSDIGYGVACDSSGNVYFVGNYTGTPTIKDQAGTSLGTLPLSQGGSAFICKFDSSGTYQYTRIVDAGGNDIAWSVVCDSSNNMYFAGTYRGTPNIKDQSNNILGTLPAGTTTQATFTCKFNSSGTYQYSLIVDATTTEDLRSISCDSSGNIYFAGAYDTASNIIYRSNSNVSTTVATLPATAGGNDAFVCKFDNTGTYQYTRIVSTTGVDFSYGVTCDSSSNMYFVGYYTGTPNIITLNSSNVAATVGTLPVSAGNAAFMCKFDSSGTYQYSLVVDASGSDIGFGVTCDSSNNVYLTGQYNGTPNIIYRSNSNVSTTVGTLPASTGNAAFMCKFNSSGTYQYSRIIDSVGTDIGYGVACDSSGNVYITGVYDGSTTPLVKDQNGTVLAYLPLNSSKTNAAFVIKFDSSGNYTPPDLPISNNRFFRVMDAAGTDTGYIVACDSSGNVYQACVYNGTPTIKNQVGTSLGTLPASSGDAGCVLKFNTTGTYQYARTIDSTTANDLSRAVACDSLGNMYVAGWYAATPTIKDQAGNSIGTLPAIAGGLTGFVSKFDKYGVYQYSRIVDSTSNDETYGVTCDSLNNMYITGHYYSTGTIKDQAGTALGTLPLSLGTDATYMCKFNSSGTYQYSRVVDGTGDNVGFGVTCDSLNNVYLCGWYGGTPNIIYVNSSNVATTVATLPAATLYAAFVSKFDSSGTYQYSLVIDASSNDYGIGVACDSSNNLYFGGYYNGTPSIKYVSSSNVSTTVGTLPASTSDAAFVCKFNSSGTYQYSRIVDAANSENTYPVSCDPSGNMYFGGVYNGTPNIITVTSSNVATTVATLPASTGNAAFMCKFDSSGTYQNAKILDSAGSDFGLGLTCDSSGNVFFSGLYTGTPTVKDQSGNSIEVLPASTGVASFLIKFDSYGATEYPVAALSATGTNTISGKSYGNGNYVVSRSSSLSDEAWRCFNKIYGGPTYDGWNAANNNYSATTGIFNGSTSSPYNKFFSVTGAYGDWVQLQLPTRVVLKYYTIYTRESPYMYMSPTTFYILGSKDGTNWTIVDYQTGLLWNTAFEGKTFDITNTTEYDYYAMLVTAVGVGNSFTCLNINEWRLFGVAASEYPPMNMTVAGTNSVMYQAYGNGNYVVSCSSFFSSDGSWACFNKVYGGPSLDGWNAANNNYNATTGVFNGSTSSPYNKFFSATGAYGDWVQIQFPSAATITSYMIYTRESPYTYMSPRIFYILGSNDSVNWSLLDSESGITWSTPYEGKTFTVATPGSYIYYAILINAVGTGNSFGCTFLNEWRLFV